MKKLSPYLIAILPLLYLAMIDLLYLVDASVSALIGVFLIYMVLSMLFTTAFSHYIDCYPRAKLAQYDFLFSLENFLLFLAEVVYWLVQRALMLEQAQNGATEGGLILLLLIILYLPHWVSYFMIRVIGIISCNRMLSGICSKGTKTVHAICHFFPATDVISSLLVLRKIKSWPKAQKIL